MYMHLLILIRGLDSKVSLLYELIMTHLVSEIRKSKVCEFHQTKTKTRGHIYITLHVNTYSYDSIVYGVTKI